MTEAPRLLILANHQHAGLATAIRALLPEVRTFSADLARLARDPEARAAAVAAAANADHIITQDAGARQGPLSTASLRAGPRPVHLLPHFRFAGFHPDGIGIVLDGARLRGPTGAVHSRIAATAYLAGFTVEEAASLYNSLVFARLGYFTLFAEEHGRLLQTFAAYGYDLQPCFDAWVRPGAFMFDATHPRMRVLLDLARLLLARIGIAPRNDDVGERDVTNPLATVATHPLFPEIAARIGVSPEGGYRGTSTGGRPALYSLESFLEESFRAFRRAPLVALRNADGVKQALNALQFAEAGFGRAVMRARALAADGEDVIFLTWHGRLLSTEIATNLLVQTLPWPEDGDSVPAAVRMSLPPSEIMVTALSGGCDVLPADRPGCVHLRRTDRLLSAPKHDVTMQFSAEIATDTEYFLALPRKFLTALRALYAGNWREATSQAYVPGAGVRLMPGFFLAVGDRRIDLANAAFEFDPDEPAQLNIIAAGESARLRRVGDAAGEVAVDHPADRETVPEAASMEQFRLAPGFRLRLRGGRELVHAPLTLDNAGRMLVHASVADGDDVRFGIRNFDTSAIRAADRIVLLCPGAEGVILDPAGRWSAASFPLGGKLPQGLAAHGGTVLLENDAWQNAPRLHAPHVVFYDPLAAGSDGPLRSAVALHALTAVMKTGARLLLPPQLENIWTDQQGILQALGFSGIETTLGSADFVRADDLLFLSDLAPHAMPAGLLHSFRDRAHALRPPPRAGRRIYVKPKTGHRILRDELDQRLMKRDFDTVIADELSETALMDAFAAASLVIAPHGPVLGNLLFCRPGTRVLELAPDKDPDPRFWLLSQRLGLFHAVLHCPLIDGRLRVVRERFRAILQMLRAMDP